LVDGLHDRPSKLRVFASVIEKSTKSQDQIFEKSFAAIAHAFDLSLTDMWARRKDVQRGRLVCDKASCEKKLQALSSRFKHQGHALGRLRNFAAVPRLLHPRASRQNQVADWVAHWTLRHVPSKNDQGFHLMGPPILGKAIKGLGC
jgi:hypothetical protein